MVLNVNSLRYMISRSIIFMTILGIHFIRTTLMN